MDFHHPLLKTILFPCLFFILGIVGASLYFYSVNPNVFEDTTLTGLRLVGTERPLISPLLLCNANLGTVERNKDLEATVTRFINKRIAEKKAEDMSVVIVDYQKKQWVGVHENAKYDPASLQKVPLMIAYMQWVEERPEILNEQFVFNGTDQNQDKYFQSKNNIQQGRSYTTEELIKGMIINSDNTAQVLLTEFIAKDRLGKVYTNLGLLSPPETGEITEYISALQYAYFFRVLFNSTYLNKDNSEMALELLGTVDFPYGIRAGVPSEVIVAHKFGERSVYANGQLINRELHDCGIVYKSESPYLLCIMSRGKDFDTLAKNMSDLSALVYKSI